MEVTFCTRVIVLNDCFQYCVPFELTIFKFSCKKKERRKRETEKERERGRGSLGDKLKTFIATDFSLS